MNNTVLRRNATVLILVCLTIAIFYFGGFASTLFWYGGMLLIPIGVVLVQFSCSLGHYLLRTLLAIAPWLVFSGIGILSAQYIEHQGRRTVQLMFFRMPLAAVSFTAVLLVQSS